MVPFVIPIQITANNLQTSWRGSIWVRCSFHAYIENVPIRRSGMHRLRICCWMYQSSCFHYINDGFQNISHEGNTYQPGSIIEIIFCPRKIVANWWPTGSCSGRYHSFGWSFLMIYTARTSSLIWARLPVPNYLQDKGLDFYGMPPGPESITLKTIRRHKAANPTARSASTTKVEKSAS